MPRPRRTRGIAEVIGGADGDVAGNGRADLRRAASSHAAVEGKAFGALGTGAAQAERHT